MQAVITEQYGNLDSVKVVSVKVPELKEGYVLVQMENSPINVSDLLSAYGVYHSKPLPVILGLEGSGKVVESGGGPLADSLVGKRVAVAADTEVATGTWAEYALINANACMPLKDEVTFPEAASMIVNPMTVALFMAKIREGNDQAIMQNAASSALGKMFIKWCNEEGVKSINLVRRGEQVEELRNLGAELVYDTSDPNWKEQVRQKCRELKVKVAFDAVGGVMTNDMMELLEPEGIVYNYGALSGENCQAFPMHLIGADKSLRGLWLTKWLSTLTGEQKMQVSEEVQQKIKGVLKTEYSKEVHLGQLADALKEYDSRKTNNKILIRTKPN